MHASTYLEAGLRHQQQRASTYVHISAMRAMHQGYQLRSAQEIFRSFRFTHRNRRPIVRRWIAEAGATASDEKFRRPIKTAVTSGRGFKEPDCLRPVPILIGCETGLVGLDPFRNLGGGISGDSEKLVDCEALDATVYGYPVEPADDDRISGSSARLFADDDVDAVDFSQPLEAAGDVHWISDNCIAQPLARADIADQHAACVDADAHPQRGSAGMLGFSPLQGEQALAFERGSTGVYGMPLGGHWCAPKRHHPVADELVDRTAAVQNRRRDRFQVLGEHGHHALAEFFGDAGEAGDISEHYRQRLLVPTGASLDALGDQRADELGRHVFLERR